LISFLRGLLGLGVAKTGDMGADWRSFPLTPEALMTQPMGVDRQIGGVGEIGMGGPNFWTMLLADGAILGGVCGPVRNAGALRTALTQDRQGLRLQVYDVEAQVIHTLTAGRGRMTPDDLDAAVAKSPSEAEPLLREACRHAVETVRLHSVHGLRLPIDSGPAPEPLLTRALSGGRRLEARLLLPADLRGTVEVGGLLSSPPYGLWLDGVTTGLHVTSLDGVVEAPDGGLVLPGVRLDADGRVLDGLWHVWRGGQWVALASYAQRLFNGGGAYTPYFLADPKLGDDGKLGFRLETFGWGPEGRMPSEPAPAEVELKVSWRAAPLRLATQTGRISVAIPGSKSVFLAEH
jgi:hypothetical protein